MRRVRERHELGPEAEKSKEDGEGEPGAVPLEGWGEEGFEGAHASDARKAHGKHP